MARSLPYVCGLVGIAALALFVHRRDRALEARLDRLIGGMSAIPGSIERVGERRDAVTRAPLARAQAIDSETIDAIATRVAALLEQNEEYTGQDPAAAPQREPPSPEQQTALERAQARLDQALVHGRLSRDDVLEMREALTLADQPEESREISRRISQAVNSEKLVPEDIGFMVP